MKTRFSSVTEAVGYYYVEKNLQPPEVRDMIATGKITIIPKFRKVAKYVADDHTTIEFVPVDKVPGYTHRVIVNSCASDWLGDNAKPSAKAAAFYYDKHILGKK